MKEKRKTNRRDKVPGLRAKSTRRKKETNSREALLRDINQVLNKLEELRDEKNYLLTELEILEQELSKKK